MSNRKQNSDRKQNSFRKRKYRQKLMREFRAHQTPYRHRQSVYTGSDPYSGSKHQYIKTTNNTPNHNPSHISASRSKNQCKLLTRVLYTRCCMMLQSLQSVNRVEAGTVWRLQINSDEVGVQRLWRQQRGGPERYPAGRCRFRLDCCESRFTFTRGPCPRRTVQ